MTTFIQKRTHVEELLLSVTHGVSAIASAFGLAFLVMKTITQGAFDFIGSIIFGASLVLLYSASATFHSSPHETKSREVLRKLDHCMIFVLILGTYVPVCWTALGGWLGWTVFAIVATCSVIGIVINMIDVRRFHKLSLVIYVVSGWTIAAATLPFVKAVGWGGFAFLLAGGVSYTVGIVFYRMTKIPYMHLIWHVLVTLGSVMHFIMIYQFVY